MATLEELEQHQQAKINNDAIRDVAVVNDFFNAYKSQGSLLLQKGKITEEQYFQQVRNMGIKIGLIGPDEYPDGINEYVKPAMSITGATIGGIIGAGLAPATGGMSLLLASSIGAGVGAGTSELAYGALQELSAPEAMPLREMEDLALDAVGEAATVGVLSVGIGHAINKAGKLMGPASQVKDKFSKTFNSQSAEKKGKVLGFIDKAKDKLSGMYFENAAFRQDIAKVAKQQGVDLPRSAVAIPFVKAIAEAFGRTGLLGRAARESYAKTREQLINRVVGGIKNGETPEQALAAFTSGFKLAKDGKIVPIKGLYDDTANFVVKQRENAMNLATQAFIKNGKRLDDSVQSNMKYIDDILEKNLYGQKTLAVPGLQRTFTQLQNNAGSLGKSLTDSLKPLLANGQLTGKQLKQLKTFMDAKYKDKLVAGLKTTEKATTQLEREGFDRLYASFNNQIGRLLKNEGALRNYSSANRTLNASLRKQKDFMENAQSSGMLNYFDDHIRNLAGPAKKEFVDEIQKKLGYKITDDVGRVQPFPGLKSNIQAGMIKAASNTNRKDFLQQLTSGNSEVHKAMVKSIGKSNYNRLAINEMNNKFEQSFIRIMNDPSNKRNLSEFTDLLRRDARNIKALIKNGNFNYTYKDLQDFGKLIQYLPSQPALNQFVARSTMLNMANGGALGALGSVTGVGALAATGGSIPAIAGYGLLYAFNRYMAQPYVRGQLTKAAAAKGAEAKRLGEGFFSGMSATMTPYYRGMQSKYDELAKSTPGLSGQPPLQLANEIIGPDFSRREEL